MAPHAGAGRGRGLPRLCAWGSGLRTVTMLERPSRETGRARDKTSAPGGSCRADRDRRRAGVSARNRILRGRSTSGRSQLAPETIVRTLSTSSTRRPAPHGDRDGHQLRLPGLTARRTASSRPARMMPTAQARLIQMPIPRLAKKKLSGIETIRTRTRIVAIEPMPIDDEALGHRRGHAHAALAYDDEDAWPRDRGTARSSRSCRCASRGRIPSCRCHRPSTSPVSAETARSKPKRNVRRPPMPESSLGTRQRHAVLVLSGAPSREAYDLLPTGQASRDGISVLEFARGPSSIVDPATATRRGRASARSRRDPAVVPAPPREASGEGSAGIARSAGRVFASGSFVALVVVVAAVLAARTLGEIERVFGL